MNELCTQSVCLSVCTADWIRSAMENILPIKQNQAHNTKAVSSAHVRNYRITQTEPSVHNGRTDSTCISLLL
jgi:hypothetical protein